MGNNALDQFVTTAEVDEYLKNIQPIMMDAARAAMEILQCSARLFNEYKDLIAKAYQSLRKTYEALGSPNGDSELGFYIWLKEQERQREEGVNG